MQSEKQRVFTLLKFLSNPEKFNTSYEIIFSEVYQITGNSVVLETKIHPKQRVPLAVAALLNFVKKDDLGEKIADALLIIQNSGETIITQKDMANNLLPVLDNFKGKGLNSEQLGVVLNGLYILTADEHLSPNLSQEERITAAKQLLENLSKSTGAEGELSENQQYLVSQLNALGVLANAKLIKDKKDHIYKTVENVDSASTHIQKTVPELSPSTKHPFNLEAKKGQTKSPITPLPVALASSNFLKKVSFSRLATLLGGAFGGPIGAAIMSGIARVLIGTFTAINRFVGLRVGGVQGFLLSLALWLSLLAILIVLGVFTVLIIPLLVGAITTVLLLSFIIFIINASAYVVPPGQIGVVGVGGVPGGIPATCAGENAPRPAASGVRFSSDGRYAFPIAPFGETYYGCRHWDNALATDIGLIGITSGGQRPVIAYTSGVISDISLNDSLGGKYIILAGNDGRYYYYAHNCALYVQPGQSVSVGEVIATTDNTGSAADTVEHVHFAINSAGPSFFNGGNICPSTDFQNKFGLGRCTAAQQCPQ